MSFAATPLFIALHSDSPRYRPLVLWEVTLGFLLFLLDLWYLRRTYPSSVSCVLLAFPLSCLNPLLTVQHASGIPSFWQPLRIPTQLSFYAGNFSNLHDLGFFSFSSFFSHKLPGLSFSLCFWASSLLGLSPLFFNFIFYGPLCYSFGPGCCDFLDLNRVLSKSQNKLKWQKKSEIM